MATVVVKIPQDLEEFVEQSVRRNSFKDAEEFILNLLHNLREESESGLTAEESARLETLRTDIQVGIGQADRQEFVDFGADDILSEGRARRIGQESKAELEWDAEMGRRVREVKEGTADLISGEEAERRIALLLSRLNRKR